MNLKKKRRETVLGTYYRWKLYQRADIYWADGRSNSKDVGRHSLDVIDRVAALEMLKQLDTEMAIENGLLENPSASPTAEFSIEAGIKVYLEHASRSQQLGGAQPKTWGRYASILHDFKIFADSKGVVYWEGVTKKLVEAYVEHLEAEGKAQSTIGHEINILKQTVKYFIGEGLLPTKSRIKVSVKIPDGTTTYCWQPAEVRAMREFCRARVELQWLEYVIVGLTCTGLRISELIGLRWSDIVDGKMIRLTDERNLRHRARNRKLRMIKNGRGRILPVNEDLRPVLNCIPHLPDGLVFHDGEGKALTGDFVRRTLINRVLIPMKDQFPGVSDEKGFQDGRLHSFRHFFCSECSNSGVPENVVMRWLGHSDSKMVRHYYHLHDAEALRQMQSVKFFPKSESLASGDPSPDPILPGGH